MILNKKDVLTYSNAISLLRLLLAIPIWILFENLPENRFVIFYLCIFAVITDLADGYVARKLNQISETGKIIDPLADKLLVIFIVVRLYSLDYVDHFYFWIIVLRDLLIFLGGMYVTKKIGMVLPSNYTGKATVISIGLVFLFYISGSASGIVFNIIYYVSIALVFVSFFSYVYRAYEVLKKKDYGNI